MTQKTTDEIRALLSNAKLNFESVENKALNEYLPKIFHNCPFTEDICTTKQCLECAVFNKLGAPGILEAPNSQKEQKL
jgi:hypothetical protein